MVSVSTATTTAVGAALGLVLVVWPLAIWLEVRKCEKPQYKVLRSLDTKRRLWWAQPAAEIRQYAPYLIAEVTVEGTNMTEALSQGFRQIANFIFGNNKGTAGSEKIDMTSPVVLEEPHEVRDTKKIRGGSGAKIAMTSPVATHMEDGKYRVSFIMPSKYTKETLPKPKNSNISIKEVPAHTLAALSWRGRRPTWPQDCLACREQKSPSSLQNSKAAMASAAVCTSENGSAAGSTTGSTSVLRQLNGPTGTPRSLSTPRTLSKRPKTPLSGASPSPALDINSAGLQFELSRLRNEVRAKQREVEAVEEEARTVKANLAVKDRALTKAGAECEALQDRALRAEGDVAKKTAELRDLEAANQKLRSIADSAERQADKLTQKIANLPKGPGFSAELAALESEVKALKAANAALSEDIKAAATITRNKDKELDAAAAKVAHADAVLVQNKELQNKILDQKRLLDEAAAAAATLQLVQRQKDAEIAKMTAAVEHANAAQAASAHSLASTTTQLQASEATVAELREEVGLLSDQLARTSAVAARVASSEVRNGAKDVGVVPVTMHLEEVRYLHGELERLKEKVRAAEKAAHVSHLLKEKVQEKLEAVVAGQAEGRPATPRLDLPTWGSVGAKASPSPRAPRSPASSAGSPAKTSPRGYAHVPSSGYGRVSPRGSGRASPVPTNQPAEVAAAASQPNAHADISVVGLSIKVREEPPAGAAEAGELASAPVSRASSAALPPGVGVSVYSIVI
ncbi:hypothetical protein WJX72_000877 [[Myrmecia] bisecta]|uniref:Uncharacterized protein n=1 Tax=[Myrmecia] bisecta TaxID=41462 RepID=A0AAW1QE16_9CHLO